MALQKIESGPLLLILVTLFQFWGLGFAVETNETDEDLMNWKPPEELTRRFPYFLSGHDREGAPFWTMEYGKWDVRSFLESGLDEVNLYDRYIDQMVLRMTTPEKFGLDLEDGSNPPSNFVTVVDLDGYGSRQLTHIPSVQKYLYIVKSFVNSLRKRNTVKKGFFVNSNFLFSTVWNLSKPIFGELLSTMELYGTKSQRWMPAVLEYVSREQLPPFLGGPKNHKPIQTHG